MPQVLRDLFAAAGVRLEDRLDLVRLGSACRYFWTGGAVIDEDAAFWREPETARFLDYARGIYELSGEAFLQRPPGEFWRALHPANWPKLRHLGKIATTRTLAREVERRIGDPRRRQIFLRFATYNGSSPYLTPATFNVIPFVEAEFGAWYVRGGMARIAAELAELAGRLGVKFRFNTTAAGWDGSEATGAGRHPPSLRRAGLQRRRAGGAKPVFSPGCPARGLGGSCSRPRFRVPASSSFLACGAAIRAWPTTIFSSRTIIPASSRRSTGRRPAPPSRRSTSPSARGAIRTTPRRITIIISSWSTCRRAIRPRRDAGGDGPLPRFDPKSSGALRAGQPARADRDGAGLHADRLRRARPGPPRGAVRLGLHSVRASLFRPPLRAGRNVFLAGGTTHPGGGIPLVLLSGKMAADAILAP